MKELVCLEFYLFVMFKIGGHFASVTRDNKYLILAGQHDHRLLTFPEGEEIHKFQSTDNCKIIFVAFMSYTSFRPNYVVCNFK